MTSINNLNSALNSLSSNQTLRANEDGSNLHTVSGFEKIGIAFQKHVLRKSPEQLGTSQAIIGKAIASLYKNEHPGATTNQISKVLDKLGFKEFAQLIKNSPALSSRSAAVESSPEFSDHETEIYGSFTKNASGRAGTAQAPAKKESLPEHLASADEIAKALEQLSGKEAKEPTAPPRKESLRSPGGNNALPEHLASGDEIAKALEQLNAKETKEPTPPPRKESLRSPVGNSALPEHLASGDEVAKAVAALNAQEAKNNVLPEHLASGEEIDKALAALNKKPNSAAALRLSSAASHGREISQAKQAVVNPAKTATSNNAQTQIADIERRLQLAEEGKHVNEDGTRVRPFKAGEKEKDVTQLKAKLAELQSTQAGESKIKPEIAKLIQNIKDGVIDETNFTKEFFPFIQGRLGKDASAIIQLRSNQYYEHLGEKARYADIGSPKHSIVPLSSGNKIHANFIPVGGLGDPAIATQAPKAGTIKDFVALIQEQNVTTIIDLTNPYDKDKRHIPDYARKPEHGFQSQDQTSAKLRDAGIEKRELQVASGEHKAAYINLTTWPDHGVVSLKTLTDLVEVIGQEHGDKAGGLCIHCTAGVGRTGTVFASIELNRLAKGGELTADNFAEKVLDVVAEGRKARGNAFVQSPPQLSLLFDYAKSLVQ